MADQGNQPPDKPTGAGATEGELDDVDQSLLSYVARRQATFLSREVGAQTDFGVPTTRSPSATSRPSERVYGGSATGHVGVNKVRSAVDGCVRAGTKQALGSFRARARV
jgi:hypothetical protein